MSFNFFNDLPRTASFTTLIEEKSPVYSFVCQIYSEKPNYFKTNAVQALQFPPENAEDCCPKLQILNLFSLIYLKLNFYQNWYDTFPFGICYQKLPKVRGL